MSTTCIININALNLTESIYEQLLELYSAFGKIDKTILTYERFCEIVCSYPSKHNVFIYMINDIIMAVITLLIEQKLIHNAKCVGHIEDFVVKKEYRSTNVGKELIDYIINFSKENNCYKIILDCNTGLESYYKRYGFENMGLYMGYYF
jgi:glucosamine-phosphate N-acetyltransferase